MRIVVYTLLAAAAVSAFTDTSPTTPSLEITTDDFNSQSVAAPAIACSSNADCLRRGLPLLRPKIRRERGRLVARASLVPTTNIQKRVAVLRASDASLVGYIQRALDSFGAHIAPASTADPLIVTIDVANGNSQLNVITNTGDTLPYLCGVRGPGSDSDSIGAGSSNYGFIVQCDGPGAANSPPYKGQNSYATPDLSQETAIFNRNPVTNEFSLQWINVDGSPPPTFLSYRPSTGRIAFTGDLDEYQGRFAGGRFPVTLRLDDL